MHRFHDPDGALFATLPQWPRMNSKPVRSIDRPRTFKLARILHLWVLLSRHNPAGIRVCSGKFQAPHVLRSRFRPRHYRASRCSDAAASRMATRVPGVACYTGCIGLYLPTFWAHRMLQSASQSASPVSISTMPFSSSGGFALTSATAFANASPKLPSRYRLTMACR